MRLWKSPKAQILPAHQKEPHSPGGGSPAKKCANNESREAELFPGVLMHRYITAVRASEGCLSKPGAEGTSIGWIFLFAHPTHGNSLPASLQCLELRLSGEWKICQNVATLTESWVSSLVLNRMYLSFTAANAESS